MTGKANYIDLIKKYPEQASHLAHSLCPLPELLRCIPILPAAYALSRSCKSRWVSVPQGPLLGR